MRNLFSKSLAVPVIAACFLALPAGASIISFQANFDGLQEVPPNASPAFGLADLTLDDVSGLVTVTTGTYQDLLGGANAVTLNGAAGPGVGAPTLLTLTLDTPGAASGTFSGGGTLAVGNIADMIAGNTYINIRSAVFPSGEIRGQLLSVSAEAPEPASIALLSLGLAAFAIRRRRRA